MRKWLVAMLLSPLAVAAPAHAEGVSEFLHPALKSGEMKVRAVMVLPLQVEVTKAGVKGAESMLQEEESFRSEVEAALVRALGNYGIRIGDRPFTDASLEDDADLRYRLADVQGRHDRLMENVSRKPKDIRKARFSMGDEIADLVAPTDVDAVVFVRASAVHNTGARRAMSWLMTGNYAGGVARIMTVRMTFVHPATGDLLALLEVFTERQLDKPMTKVVNKLPR